MYQIEYGTETIHYSVSYRNRKTLGINVYPDSGVEVIAPIGTSISQIESKVLKRAFWITRQQNYFGGIQKQKSINEFVSGETHKYLGRSYRLKVTKSKVEYVKLRGKFFQIQTQSKESKHVSKLLEQWYKDHALAKFKQRLLLCYKEIAREGISFPKLKIRSMAKRWGSCTTDGQIILNPNLVKSPVYCIDYVIIHELCHLKHHNHSPAFYALKSKYLPDWEVRKRKLEVLG